MADIEQAFNLIGGHELPDVEQVLLGRIRANDFTMEDAVKAVAIVQRRHDELMASSNDDVFRDAKLQALWADGVRSAAQLAARLAGKFLNVLNCAVAAHLESNH